MGCLMEKSKFFSDEDLVLLIPLNTEKIKDRHVIQLHSGEKFHTKNGMILHDDIIGKTPGSIISTHIGFNYIALDPTLKDIIKHYPKFRYKTQIIYPRDWGLIMAFAGIKNGDLIVEIGTGSGAFTAFLSNIIGPEGKIFSYEVDPDRARIAEENLRNTCSTRNYIIKIKNAEDGIDERDVDIVFIDVPEPWRVLRNAWQALRFGGRVVVYIPTFNQLQKTLKVMLLYGFIDVSVKEGFIRDFQIKPYAVRPKIKGYYFSAFIVFGRKGTFIPIKQIKEALKKFE